LPVSVSASAADPNLLTAYAAADPTNSALTVIVINKNPDYDYNAQLQLTGFVPEPTAAVYQVSAANLAAILREPDITNAAPNMAYVFPAYSATLLRFTATAPINSAATFQITDIRREGNDIAISWMTGAGATNMLERSAGYLDGSYSNAFVPIFAVTNTTSAITNYMDLGAATNRPASYYRVRLVP
jgi:hypothetical protein